MEAKFEKIRVGNVVSFHVRKCIKMGLPAIATDVIERIVLMAIHEIPQVQIAQAVGLTEARISQIMDMEEYKEKFSIAIVEVVESQQAINDGWETIETRSVAGLLDILEYNKDPDFLLRVAAVANKTVRRGGNNIRPINGDAGVRAIIHLTQNFIEKINMNGKDKDPMTIENIPQKQEDFLSPDGVDKLLKPKKEEVALDLLADFKVQHHA